MTDQEAVVTRRPCKYFPRVRPHSASETKKYRNDKTRGAAPAASNSSKGASDLAMRSTAKASMLKAKNQQAESHRSFDTGAGFDGPSDSAGRPAKLQGVSDRRRDLPVWIQMNLVCGLGKAESCAVERRSESGPNRLSRPGHQARSSSQCAAPRRLSTTDTVVREW